MNTTIRTLAQAVRNGEISSSEILDDSLELAHQVQRDFNCFAEIAVTDARRQAERIDALVAAGTDPGRLAGVVVAIKDVTPVTGMGNRAGSPSQANVRATKDAVLVERLRGAGAIIIGKTTLPEHAYSSFCDSPLYGITRNPWNRDRTPGGSSGGSAVAVATGAAMLGEGTDMGGSIRIPAAFTGVVGIKPSFGRIPNDDMPSLFDDIQHHGLLARTVDDIALALECVSGAHPSDPQTGITALPALDVTAPLDGMSIALSYNLDSFIVEEEIILRLREVADVLAAAGAKVEEVRTGLTREMRRGWVGHWTAYLAAHCADKTDERSDPRLRGHIEAGLRIGAADLLRLDSLRAALWQALSNNVWQHHDLLLCPTMTHPAVSVDGDDEQYRAGGLDMTSVFNWAPWCPAISVPAGLSRDGGGVSFVHQHGCGHIGDDVEQTEQAFVGVATNPNVAGTLVVSLGCETIQGRRLADKIGAIGGNSVRFVGIQSSGGFAEAVAAGDVAPHELSQAHPEPARSAVSPDALMLGIDAAVGDARAIALTELAIRCGATVVLGYQHRNGGPLAGSH